MPSPTPPRAAKVKSRNPAMAERIARLLPTLSPSHRQMVDYVQGHPLRAATMPIDEMAATVGVSVATANRFARALGFDGYAQFRAALVLGFESTLAPVERLRSTLANPASAGDVFAAALAEIQHNTQRSQQALNAEDCERAVKAILAAERVFIIGFGASSWLGGLLERNLTQLRDNVRLLASIEGSSSAARSMTRLTRSDLVIALAFPRYFADTIALAERARDLGTPVLGLTDKLTSPLAALATITLYAHTESRYFANSEASTLALVEALTSAVAFRAEGSLQAAAGLAEAVLPWLHTDHPARARGVSRAGTATAYKRPARVKTAAP